MIRPTRDAPSIDPDAVVLTTGTVSLRPSTLSALLFDVLASLGRTDFREADQRNAHNVVEAAAAGQPSNAFRQVRKLPPQRLLLALEGALGVSVAEGWEGFPDALPILRAR